MAGELLLTGSRRVQATTHRACACHCRTQRQSTDVTLPLPRGPALWDKDTVWTIWLIRPQFGTFLWTRGPWALVIPHQDVGAQHRGQSPLYNQADVWILPAAHVTSVLSRPHSTSRPLCPRLHAPSPPSACPHVRFCQRKAPGEGGGRPCPLSPGAPSPRPRPSPDASALFPLGPGWTWNLPLPRTTSFQHPVQPPPTPLAPRRPAHSLALTGGRQCARSPLRGMQRGELASVRRMQHRLRHSLWSMQWSWLGCETEAPGPPPAEKAGR